ncbi:MAG: FliA/WhiG family RNA polymerase sigma factor [Deltaproteobacteria bacterium]|nr:MAG: FliA/WhiG family RNA polymerase sigma factor [Deltaproteobacteria bacterium]HDG97867.1 FliA/WhiG family RNA polymerase sigma factor [Desulfobacterales bacterium]
MTSTATRKARRYDQEERRKKTKRCSIEKEEYVYKYAPLIKTIAGRLAMKLPPHVDQDDLLSAGIMGLLDAIEKFDPDKGVAFKSYAEFRIRGAMLDELRAMDWVPRSVRKNAKMLEEAYEKVENRKMGPASDSEVAKELNMNLESFYKLLEETRGVSIINEEELGELMSHRHINGLWEMYQDKRASDPVAHVDYLELRKVVAEAIDKLPEKEKLVVSLYYYEELTMKEIGEVMGYTESRISQLHTKAVIRLRNRIRNYFMSELPRA